ncbi:KGGVGR-motif variant AAA ATPase [Kineococcus sp. TBRC 1896]|uniref:KGGVGR-motif variant AAA ATPase n=1 Tax=Kineococcus mangrovi TaxID=1660183 RepID=A0ABV4I3P8_9ACTN
MNFGSAGRFFTWVDVDAAFETAAHSDNWPTWLREASAFWGGLTLEVTTDDEDIVLGWLEEIFGPGSILKDDEDSILVLDDLPGRVSTRHLPIEIERSGEDMTDQERRPRWRENRITGAIGTPLPSPEHPIGEQVSIVAFHSFKGGVGRTLHAVALAHALKRLNLKVLIVDADLEAPGVSWMYQQSGREIDFSFEDMIALLHASRDGSVTDAATLAAAYTKNQTLDDILIMPSRRELQRIAPARIEPQHLLTPNRSPYFLTDGLVELGRQANVDVILVDLRAGASELAAPLLLDPRIQKVFVTTVSAQSADGTAMMIRAINTRAPSQATDPGGSLIVTQYRRTDQEAMAQSVVAPLVAELRALNSAGGNEEAAARETGLVDDDVRTSTLYSGFQEALLGLSSDWDDLAATIHETGLLNVLHPLARELALRQTPEKSAPQEAPSAAAADDRRRRLADFSKSLAYAETTEEQAFLPTESLRNLVEAHKTTLPLCVVTGAKGAGKTFTQLQMLYTLDWRSYADRVDVPGAELSAPLVPTLYSRNMSDDTRQRLDAILEQVGVSESGQPATQLEIREMIGGGLEAHLSDRQWRHLWLALLAKSIGADVRPEEAEKFFIELGRTERRIFLIDGLEDTLPEVTRNPEQQRALRVLLADCIEWLQSLRGRPFGLIVFVRIDLVRAAFPQNSAQFLARYQDFSLRWDPSEAKRLALWLAQSSSAMPGVTEDVVREANEDDLNRLLIDVWGEKMGSLRSREARSSGWFLAALSDFNDNIQARDIVIFMQESARRSIGEARWTDRLLAPAAMRDALITCSSQKISAISEESPVIGDLLQHLRNLGAEERQVPFTQDSVQLSITQLELLAESGVVFREDDRFWIPEIFRHGLGFRASGRPRVVAVANLVRKRNNSE